MHRWQLPVHHSAQTSLYSSMRLLLQSLANACKARSTPICSFAVSERDPTGTHSSGHLAALPACAIEWGHQLAHNNVLSVPT